MAFLENHKAAVRAQHRYRIMLQILLVSWNRGNLVSSVRQTVDQVSMRPHGKVYLRKRSTFWRVIFKAILRRISSLTLILIFNIYAIRNLAVR